MTFWSQPLGRLRDHFATHYWDGKPHWRRRDQLVYAPDENRPDFIPITALFMCVTLPYDNLGFWDFPQRMGWVVHRYDRRCHSGRCPPGNCIVPGESARYGLQTPAISKVDGSEVSVAEKVSFLQAWLFFGALAELSSLCGLTIDIGETFVFGDTVTTAGLNGLPIKLFSASQRSKRAGTGELRSRLHALSREVQLMITRAGEFEDEHEYTFSECQVLCSIHILLRAILLTFLCHSPGWNVDPGHGMTVSVGAMEFDWAHEGQSTMGTLMLSRLLEKGWCQSELNGLGYDMLFFVYFIDRPEAHRDHARCTETRCLASQTSEEDYKTAHTTIDCKCNFISIDLEAEQVPYDLSQGKIPKIIISQDLKLSVVHDEDYPFVAISHVWADGLGNPFQNSLPRCQLQRLRDYVTVLCRILKLSPRHPLSIWIDTLCIPVARHLKKYRQLAIGLLRKTYNDATVVLVLDRELYSVDSQKLSNLELGIRVMSGGWIKRLWTLQEAALSIDSKTSPGKMYFQMGDGPIRWNPLLHSFQPMLLRSRYKPLKHPPKTTALTSTVQEIKESLLFGLWVQVSMTDHLPSVKDLGPYGFDPQLQRLIGAVQNRMTSKLEDESICLASLAGLDLTSILSVRTAEERMQQLYLLLRKLPMAIIFMQFPTLGTPYYIPTPYLNDAPFRWAPASLLLHTTEAMNMHQAYAAQRFADAEYHMEATCEADGLHIKHNGLVFLSEVMPSSTCIFEDAASTEQYCLTWSGGAPPSIHRDLALIFETDICSKAVIVHIEDRRDSDDETELYVRIVGFGVVRVHGERVQGEVVNGVRTPFKQRWCLT